VFSLRYSCPGLSYASHITQPVFAVRTQAVVFSLRYSCPGLSYASHITQPVFAVRTQAVVFSLRYNPTWRVGVTKKVVCKSLTVRPLFPVEVIIVLVLVAPGEGIIISVFALAPLSKFNSGPAQAIG